MIRRVEIEGIAMNRKRLPSWLFFIDCLRRSNRRTDEHDADANDLQRATPEVVSIRALTRIEIKHPPFFMSFCIAGFAGAIGGAIAGLLSEGTAGILWSMLAGSIGAVICYAVALLLSGDRGVLLMGAVAGGHSGEHGSVWQALITGIVGGSTIGVIAGTARIFNTNKSLMNLAEGAAVDTPLEPSDPDTGNASSPSMKAENITAHPRKETSISPTGDHHV
jgi:hypothetical protein